MKKNKLDIKTVNCVINWQVGGSKLSIHLADAPDCKHILLNNITYIEDKGITVMTLEEFNNFVLKVHSFFKEAEQLKRSSKSG